jgi:hypothetical protein
MSPLYRTRRPRGEFPCTFPKACYALWGVLVMRWSQTRTAHVVGLPAGTESHVVRGERFPDAYPIPLPGYDR